MKVITIPADVTEARVVGKDEPVKLNLGFKDFLKIALENYPECGKGLKNIRKANKISELVEKADKTIVMDDELLEFTKAAVESMSWNPAAARAMLPYFDALEGAKEWVMEKK